MLATRNFSGRWQGLRFMLIHILQEVGALSDGGWRIWVPSGQMGAVEDSVTEGLAHLIPPAEAVKVKGHQAKDPPGRVRR